MEGVVIGFRITSDLENPRSLELKLAYKALAQLPAEFQAGARAFLETAEAAQLPLSTLPFFPSERADVLGSRLGGAPALASMAAWPRWTHDDDQRGRPLEFIAQIRLDGLPTLATLPLPKTGLLSFFASTSVPYRRGVLSKEHPAYWTHTFQAAVRYTEDVTRLQAMSLDGMLVVDGERYEDWGGYQAPNAVGLQSGELSFSFPPQFVHHVAGGFCGDESTEHLVDGGFEMGATGHAAKAYRPSGVGVRLGGALRYSKEDANPDDWQSLPRSILHVSAYGEGWPDESSIGPGNLLSEAMADGFLAFVTDPARSRSSPVDWTTAREIHSDIHRRMSEQSEQLEREPLSPEYLALVEDGDGDDLIPF